MNLDAERIALDRERGRRSLAAFVRAAWSTVEPNELRWSWHMDAICAHLEAVSSGEIRKLVINVPPGMSKSLLVSTFWPAWDWIRKPSRRIIAATYGQDLSEKNAKLHRDLVQSPWYRERWPEVRIRHEDIAKVREFKNSAHGWRFSTSVGGPATGRHADILLGDDLVKAQDSEGRSLIDPVAIQRANDFWFKTMMTRRADAASTALVLIAQRLHHEDAPGLAIEQGYTSLILPMEFDPARRCSTVVQWRGARFEDPRTEKGELLDPVRFPAEVVEDYKTTMGPLTSEAQLAQNPTPREGGIFKRVGDFLYRKSPDKGRRIITVDCAFKDKKSSDFVAVQAWASHEGKYYLLDEILDRLNLGGTMRAIETMHARHGGVVHVEDKANGPAVIEILTGELPGVQAWSPGTASKTSRAEAVAHLYESGLVLLPEDADWLGAYCSDLARFPMIRHDDRVDASTMALLILHQPKTSRYIEAIAKMKRGIR